MTLVKFSNPYAELFDRFFGNDMLDWSSRNFSDTNTTVPSVNIKEDDEGFKVEMAAPGLTKEDFRVELNNDVLTISSEKRSENEINEGEHYSKREFSYQAFSRSFTLPHTIQSNEIKAKYENGILYVTIPKKEEAKTQPSKQIEVL